MMKLCKDMLLLLSLISSVIVGLTGQETKADQSSSPSVQPKASLWQKITTPIMSWFGTGNNKTEKEFEMLKANWTTIFENMQKEMLRVNERRRNADRMAKDGEKSAVKVPNWEDIFQFVYMDEQTTIFMGNTFESAAERAYGCKRAFEAKEWSLDELKKECKLPKKMGRENGFKLWTEKTKQFEVGQSVFECMRWTQRQEEKKLKKIFNAFLEGAPLPENICQNEEFREINENEKSNERKETDKKEIMKEEKKTNEKKENEKEKNIIKERNSWEKIRAQWSGKEAETERQIVKEESGKDKKHNSWQEEKNSREREGRKRQIEKGKMKKRKISPEKRLMRKKIEEQRNAAYSEQESGENDKNREKQIKSPKVNSSSTEKEGDKGHRYGVNTNTVGWDSEQPKRDYNGQQKSETEIIHPNDGHQQYGNDAVHTVKVQPQLLNNDTLISSDTSTSAETEFGTVKSKSEYDYGIVETNVAQTTKFRHDSFLSDTSTESKSSDDEVDHPTRDMLKTKNERQKGTDNKSAIGGNEKAEDGTHKREQQELIDLANSEPELWLNEFGDPSLSTDQRVAKWECHTLTDREQMADCRSWEELHRAIRRFIKFRIAKGTESGQNDGRFLTKVAIRPRFFAEKKQLEGQNAEISLLWLMEHAQAVHSGQLGLDLAPTMWNKMLVGRVEEWAEFLKENQSNGTGTIGQTERQSVLRAQEILRKVNDSEEILEGIADEKSVPLFPYKHSRWHKVNWISRKKSEGSESSVSSSVSMESRTAIKTKKMKKVENSNETIGERSENEEEKEEEEEASENEKYKGQFGILNFVKRRDFDFWLRQTNSANWNCKRLQNNVELCQEWVIIHRAIRRYLAFLETIKEKTMADFRESDLANIALFPRLKPEVDSKALTINNKAWIARLWGKFMTKDDGQFMDLKEAMRKVEEAHKLVEIGQVKEPMELRNKTLVQRVEGWAQFYAEKQQQELNPSVQQAKSILTYVLVQIFDERNRVTPKLDMKIVEMPPEYKENSTEKSDEQNNTKLWNEKLEKLPIDMKNSRQKIVEFEKVPTKNIRNRMGSRKSQKRRSNSKSKEEIWERRRALNAKIRQKSQKLNGSSAKILPKSPKPDDTSAQILPKKDDGQLSNERTTIYERRRESEEEKEEKKEENTTPNEEKQTSIWQQKSEFNSKIRKIIKEIYEGKTIYLTKGKKPIKSDAIWPIFVGIESAKDEKQLKNVEKLIPPKETDEEKEKRTQMLEKWKKIEQNLREQSEKYGTDAYANRLKNAKTNAPNQLVIVYTNFFGFKKNRVVLIPNFAEVVHTVYQVKNGNNTYSMLGENVFEAWKKAAKCVETVQNGQIYMGGKECQVEIEAESRTEMIRKWTNLGKALQLKIGALYKENDGMFDDQKFMLLLENAYGALLNGSALPPLPPNVSETVEQKLYGEMLEKSAQMNERSLIRAFSRQKSILSENPIGDMKRTLSEKAREMLRKFWTGESVYLVKTKPVNADTIWRLFDQIERAHDEKAVKNAEKEFPDEGPPEMREYQLQKWHEIEHILREQMEAYGRERYALRQQNVDPNGPNADDVLVLNESKFFGLLRKKRPVLIPKADEIVHTVYRIEKPDKKTGFAAIEHFGPNIFGAWKRAAQCLDAVQNGQQYASANEDCNWQMRTEYRHETAYKRWRHIGRAMKRGSEAKYKINKEILDEQKLLQLLEKAFVALVNGTELPALPEKVSAEEMDSLKSDGEKSADQKTMSKSQTTETKSWWDRLKSYLPSSQKENNNTTGKEKGD